MNNKSGGTLFEITVGTNRSTVSTNDTKNPVNIIGNQNNQSDEQRKKPDTSSTDKMNFEQQIMIPAEVRVDAHQLKSRTKSNMKMKCFLVKRNTGLLSRLFDLPKVDFGRIDQDSPLTLAIRSGKIKQVKRLIKAGVEINYSNSKKTSQYGEFITPLHANMSLVEFSSQGYALKLRDLRREAIADAVEKCNVKILRLLLKHGADPNCDEGTGDSMLLSAACAHRHKIPMLKILLDHGADIYSRGVFNQLLHDNEVEGVRMFLERGYDLEKYVPISKKGTLSFELERGKSSALHCAALDRPEQLKLLLKAGADINHVNRFGQTPLETSLKGRSTLLYRCIQLLVEAGANIKQSVIDRLIRGFITNVRNYDDLYCDGSSDSENDSSCEENEYFSPDKWKFFSEQRTRRERRLNKKALCVIKSRILYESRFPSVEDPILEKIKKSKFLRTYYDKCKSEIEFFKNYRFQKSVSCYDILVDEDSWKRVRTSWAFRRFSCESESGTVYENTRIYRLDLDTRSELARCKWELWHGAAKGLECLLEFDRNLFHLIYTNIMNRLQEEDLVNLDEIKILMNWSGTEYESVTWEDSE
ncbi:hypothetical protein QAD02_000150 [Eretmocerus hayati]|uniref:Uncharacterized protein n=1 Tax=Eretmocerus hayati TaxID=131215 RepID=A0ACC2NE75_9HYME|nr:hypothetical protein QAD02_000150 [Eretmocerus hayati]